MGAAFSTETPVNDIPLKNNDDTPLPETIRKYKWKKDLPDHRDHNHSFSDNVLLNLSMSEDLREYMPPVYDQGELGSCTANAIAGAFQFDEIKQYRQQILDMREEEKKITEKEIFDKWSGILAKPKPVTRSMSSKRKKKRKSKIVDKVVELNKEDPVLVFEAPIEPRKTIIFTPSRLFIYYNEREWKEPRH